MADYDKAISLLPDPGGVVSKERFACHVYLARGQYYRCHGFLDLAIADFTEAIRTIALVTGTRYRVEEFFEEGKGYLGMAQYEARAWSSWYHHMSLVALAHLLVTLTQLRLKKKLPS